MRETIHYINAEAPTFDIPPYRGNRYSALVPDTYDVEQRAVLAIHGITSPTDSEADHEIYWRVVMHGDRPIMLHDNNDQIQTELQQSLQLLRVMTASDLNSTVDRRWMEAILRMQGPDGLIYYPVRGRPWQAAGAGGEQYGLLPAGEHVTGPYNCGELLGAVALYYLRSREELWKEFGSRIVDGLLRLGVDRGDYLYYPKGLYGLGERSDPSSPIPGPFGNMAVGWVAQGVLQYAKATGCEPAMALAGKLVRFLRTRAGMYAEDGAWLPDRTPPDTSTHFHAHAYPLIGMLEYGLLAGDAGLVERVRRGYEFGKEHGETILGFFPENVRTSSRQTSELCEVGDMITLALKLSQAGVCDCWDDADRWIRNMLAEGQLASCDWMYRVARGEAHPSIDPVSQSEDRVGERNIGAFAGWPAANDFFGARANGHGNIFMHCCTANCSRTLYYVWEHILEHDDGSLKVNLLLNRSSPWADVASHIPYDGRVDVAVKQRCAVSVRIPEWVRAGDVECRLKGAPRRVEWRGRYAVVGEAEPGDEVTLTFPIAERSDRVHVEKEPYTLVRKGNEVVVIDPPGRYAPLFQREHYRQEGTRWRKVERFIPDETVRW